MAAERAAALQGGPVGTTWRRSLAGGGKKTQNHAEQRQQTPMGEHAAGVLAGHRLAPRLICEELTRNSVRVSVSGGPQQGGEVQCIGNDPEGKNVRVVLGGSQPSPSSMSRVAPQTRLTFTQRNANR